MLAGVNNYLYALDPATGKPVASFGEDGRIDLRKGLRGDYRQQSVVLTSPGVIYKDMIIVGGQNPETPPAPPGDIRAFDSRTGALLRESKLPFSGVATPTTYMVDGKQYIVITVGGGKNSRVPLGGVYVAFALP